MEAQNNGVIEIDIKELFLTLLHKIWLIAIFGILFAACGGAVSKYLMEPIYTSTTQVYVINRQEENSLTLSDLQTGTQLTKDYMILVKSRPVMEQVIDELKLTISIEQLAGMIVVDTPEDTRILEISANYSSAEMAKQIADSVARISAERMVSVMAMEKVNIVEEGNLPGAPSSPSLYKNVSLGGLVGVMLACLVICIGYLLNDTIKSSEDIEKYLNLTTLSNIPFEEEIGRNKGKRSKSKGRKTALAS